MNRKDFFPLTPIPLASKIKAIRTIMRGRLHRYNQKANQIQPTTQAERQLSKFFDGRFVHLVNSGGVALQIALKASGLRDGDHVATNVYTLSPVSGAIMAVGAQPVYINPAEDLTPCISHLETLFKKGHIKALALSHMRGRIPNLIHISKICAQYSIPIIEDCAHALGSRYENRLVGTFGEVGVFSLQENKPINTGEGGFLITEKYSIYEAITKFSGSYEFPSTFTKTENENEPYKIYPNLSARIDEVRASLIPNQLKILSKRKRKSQRLYDAFVNELELGEYFKAIPFPQKTDAIRLSVQFRTTTNFHAHPLTIERRLRDLKIPAIWVNRPAPKGYHSKPAHWGYFAAASANNLNAMKQLEMITEHAFDLPIPLHFTEREIRKIAKIINDSYRARKC